MILNHHVLLRKSLLPAILIITLHFTARSQAVYENYRNEIYNYLYRMSQKGLIDFNDNIRPILRYEIARNLQQLRANTGKLTGTEKKELAFYLEEYDLPTDSTVNYPNEVRWFKKNENGRWRSFTAKGKDVQLNIDPIIGSTYAGQPAGNYSHRSIGAQFSGTIGDHGRFQIYGR